jgi:hypothetical protein
MAREKMVVVWSKVSASERAKLDEAAKRAKTSVSKFIRYCIKRIIVDKNTD